MQNPFTSFAFSSVWSKHFCTGQPNNNFDFIKNLSFVKKNLFPALYINVGQNHTKGISYSLTNEVAENDRNKVWLIYDVPEYFKVSTTTGPNWLGVKKIKQYPGYLIDLRPHENLGTYLSKNFSKSSRYKLKKYRKRLEHSFNINYKMFYGAMEGEEHEAVFASFHQLLVKRFSEKRIRNNNLDAKEWNFYKAVSLPMIREKKAALFVIYDSDKPIAVTLNFMNESVIFDAITTFDTDYSKFNLGYTNIMGLIEWGLDNGFDTLDFSKGYFDYKERWATERYSFDYHILYNKKHLPAVALANTLALYFGTKRKLRDWQIGEKVNKIRYFLKSDTQAGSKAVDYQLEELKQLPNPDSLVKVALDTDGYNLIKEALYSFLYLKSEHIQNVSLYKEINGNSFFIQGKENVQKVKLKT